MELAEDQIGAEPEPFVDAAQHPPLAELAQVVDPGAESMAAERERVAPPAGEVVLLEDDDLLPPLGERDGGGEPPRARSDDDDVCIHATHLGAWIITRVLKWQGAASPSSVAFVTTTEDGAEIALVSFDSMADGFVAEV
jgi:hypothetical protein